MARWSIKIDRFVGEAKGDVVVAVRKVGMRLFRRVVLASPVDTGRFRGNWTIGLNSVAPSDGYRGGASAKQGGDSGSNGAAATSQSLKQLPKLDKYDFGVQTIHFSNTLPYAIPLEQGSSAQAPKGVVRMVVKDFRAEVAAANKGGPL